MKSNRLFAILILSLLCSPSAAQSPVALGSAAGNWRLVGPKASMQSEQGGDVGRINAFVFHPTDPHTIYAATPVGGVWRTQDDGANWVLLSELRKQAIQDLVIDPLAPATIYMLTGDGEGRGEGPQLAPSSVGVLKSTDGGQNWVETSLRFNPNAHVYGFRLAIDPAQPAILLCATSAGLWRTTDGGQNWSPVTTGILAMDRSRPIFFDVLFHPTNPSIVYAATMTTIYKSTDSGATWTALSGGLPTYNQLNTPPNKVNRTRLAVTPAKPDTLYVLYGATTGFTIGLYRSDDQGRTFSKRSSTPPLSGDASAPPPIDLTKPNVFGRRDNDYATQSWYDIAMAVSPSNADIVHVGGVDTWVSTDGGQTWHRTSRWNNAPDIDEYVHADIHMMAYHNGAFYASTDGGIYRSDDDGKKWKSITRMTTGITIAQIYHVCSSPQQPDVFYYGAQDNGTYRLGIDGQIRKVAGGDGLVCQVDAHNSNTVYVSWPGGAIGRLDDVAHACAACTAGSTTFAEITPKIGRSTVVGGWLTPYILAPNDPTSIYGCYADLWHSPDRGFDWKNLSNGVLGTGECKQVAVSAADPKTIYVAKEGDAKPTMLGGGGVFRSTDGGATWQAVNAGLPLGAAEITDLAVSPSDARRVWVTFAGYRADAKVFSTTDGGATWTNISSGLPGLLPADSLAAVSGPKHGVYIGLEAGIYYRDDSLNAWVPFSNGLPSVVITSLLVQEAQHRLVAATFGRGVWVSELHAP